jgi:hypothetical protein
MYGRVIIAFFSDSICVSGLGFQVSGFRFRVSGFGFRGWVFGVLGDLGFAEISF